MVLLPFLLALLLTYLLNPLVARLVSRGLSRPTAILVAYLGVAAAATGFVVWVVPGVLREMDALVRAVPGFTVDLQALARNLQAGYSRAPLPESLRLAVDDAVVGLEERFVGLINSLVESIVGLFPLVANILLAPILAFYMLCDLERFREGLTRILPREYRRQLVALGREVNDVVYGYIMGQMTVALVEGLLVGLVMLALGLRFVFLVASFYAVAELIPYFGPVIGAVPAVISAALVSPGAVVKLAVALVILQQVEASVLAPYFVGGRLGLHPLVVVFSLLVGGHFYGVVGLLLSVPVAALLRVLGRFVLRMVDRERQAMRPEHRPGLTKIRSWRIVNSRIARPLARPERARTTEKGNEG
jgi:predicted PurR-regulated permease PerM